MMHSEWFKSAFDLTKYVNDNHIKQSQIVSITQEGYEIGFGSYTRYTLFWYE